MAIDKTRKGQRVRNTLTGQTATIEYHYDGYNDEKDLYLVTLDQTTPSADQDWWQPGDMTGMGSLEDGAEYYTEFELRNEIRDQAEALRIAPEYRDPKWFEGGVDYLEYLTTVLEYGFQGGQAAADEGVLRAGVRARLTPDHWVEIPGLGRSIPVSAHEQDDWCPTCQ